MWRATALIAAIFVGTGVLSVAASDDQQLYHNFTGYTFVGEPGTQAVLSEFEVMVIDAEGRVVATGDRHLKEQYPQAEQHDLMGRTVLPGLVDAHGHLSSLGQNLNEIDLRDASSRTRAVARVANYAQDHQSIDWILGRGWNQENWPDNRFPSRDSLDEVVSDRPVWLIRVDAHAGWANSRALELAGITAETPDPDGGQIIRDDEGEPTGVLIDTAMQMVTEVLPDTTRAERFERLNSAFEHVLELGLTQVHDAGVSATELEVYEQLHNEGNLPLRVNLMISGQDPELPELLAEEPFHSADDRRRVAGVKLYGDGALGSRGARLIDEYSDDEGNYGLLVTPEDRVASLFNDIHTAGYQINYHAIGDYTNQLALDIFADLLATEAEQAEPWQTDPRHRIEHAQIVTLEDIPRFAELDIIPSMQPTHATSDMNMAENRVGSDRIAGAYAWRTFLEQGSLIAAGSDFPVELANPFYGIHAAVTRQNRDNEPVEGWYPEQRLTVAETLRSFTLDAAYAGHMEATTGSLENGKWADFIVVDKDPFAIPAEDLWRINVISTHVAGERVYRQPR